MHKCEGKRFTGASNLLHSNFQIIIRKLENFSFRSFVGLFHVELGVAHVLRTRNQHSVELQDARFLKFIRKAN